MGIIEGMLICAQVAPLFAIHGVFRTPGLGCAPAFCQGNEDTGSLCLPDNGNRPRMLQLEYKT